MKIGNACSQIQVESNTLPSILRPDALMDLHDEPVTACCAAPPAYSRLVNASGWQQMAHWTLAIRRLVLCPFIASHWASWADTRASAVDDKPPTVQIACYAFVRSIMQSLLLAVQNNNA